MASRLINSSSPSRLLPSAARMLDEAVVAQIVAVTTLLILTGMASNLLHTDNRRPRQAGILHISPSPSRVPTPRHNSSGIQSSMASIPRNSLLPLPLLKVTRPATAHSPITPRLSSHTASPHTHPRHKLLTARRMLPPHRRLVRLPSHGPVTISRTLRPLTTPAAEVEEAPIVIVLDPRAR